MTHQFKLDMFEGPLDLLLYLIKEHKMDIHDIPIAEITRQYMDAIQLMEELNLELTGEYLVMAAELTRIKSLALLPTEVGEREEEEGKDPRAQLLARLLEYQRYKSAAMELRKMESDRQQVFPGRGDAVLEEEEEEALVDATVFDLFSAFRHVLAKKALGKDYDFKITTLSVTEMIKKVLEVLDAAESVTFESLFTVINTKQEVIVTFLAILELIRLRLIRVVQPGTFETIRVYISADRETQRNALKDFDDSLEQA